MFCCQVRSRTVLHYLAKGLKLDMVAHLCKKQKDQPADPQLVSTLLLVELHACQETPTALQHQGLCMSRSCMLAIAQVLHACHCIEALCKRGSASVIQCTARPASTCCKLYMCKNCICAQCGHALPCRAAWIRILTQCCSNLQQS